MIETLIAASSAITTIVTVSCADINTLVDRAKVYPDLSKEDRQEIIDLYYDKFGKGSLQGIDFGRGNINPQMWGYKTKEKKKKGRRG